MRSFEFLLEDIDSLTTYLLLIGFNMKQIKNDAKDSLSDFQDSKISYQELEVTLYELNKQVRNILISDVWDRFIDDPDRTILLKQASELYKEIDSYLK